MDNQENQNKEIKIYTNKNIHELAIDKPPLEDGQIYIYALLNFPSCNVKIGKTTNMQHRHQSLQGSNGGGNRIVACYCSPATWIQGMEKTCHNHYEWCRIQGTEWFSGDKVKFEEVVEYIDDLFHTNGYEICNELRKQLISEV